MSKPTKPLIISINGVEIGRITPTEITQKESFTTDRIKLPIGSKVRLTVENEYGISLEAEGVIEPGQS